MTKIVAIDSETTSIRPDRRVWDLALIVLGDEERPWPRDGGAGPGTYQWFIDVEDLDLGNADPFALRIGRFYDRHPQMNTNAPGRIFGEVDVLRPSTSTREMADPPAGRIFGEVDVLRRVERLTRGAHLLGAVPNFDADVLDRRMRAHGILPSFHYHLIDIEAMAVGFLHGAGGPGQVSLPWKSDELSRACGVEPPSEQERHSALGDARWCARWWESITGGKP